MKDKKIEIIVHDWKEKKKTETHEAFVAIYGREQVRLVHLIKWKKEPELLDYNTGKNLKDPDFWFEFEKELNDLRRCI